MRKLAYTIVALLGVALGYFIGSAISSNPQSTTPDTTLTQQIAEQEDKIKELQDSVDNYRTQLAHYTEPTTLTNDMVESFISSIDPSQSKEQIAAAVAAGTAHINLGSNNTATYTTDDNNLSINMQLIDNNIISIHKDNSGNITSVYVYNTVTNHLSTVEDTIVQGEIDRTDQ